MGNKQAGEAVKRVFAGEKDMKILSLAEGLCRECGQRLDCSEGCYSPDLYGHDIDSNSALDQGICLKCRGKVDCPSGHLGSGRNDAHLVDVVIKTMRSCLSMPNHNRILI